MELSYIADDIAEEMVKTSMTKDEIIMELMELLKQNDCKKQAGEVFEM